MAKMAIDPKDRPRVKAECLRLLVTLKLDPARRRFISGFIDTYLRLRQEEQQVFDHLITTEFLPTEQEQAMELTTSWKEEGIQQGLKQGFHQGEYHALKRLLTRRFQTLPADVLARIETAPVEQLEQWLDNTLDAVTLEDVFRSH
jgi:flagellar biosynthesis/type III secretory pathway protein FliH